VRYIIRDDISHGITKVLYAISKKRSFIKLHNIYSSIVASSLTIGFGGSVGAEAPIVLTGSAIGSNVGRWFKVSRGTMMLMVGCGASAALAGVFKAPITGVVFVFEVLLLDLTMTSILPLLISSCTSATLSYLLEGNDKMFRFIEVEGFAFSRLHYVLLLGIFCGVVSLYFIYSMNYAEGLFAKFSNPYKKLLFGGIVLSLLIYLFPPLYGEGYETIASLLEGEGGKMIENSPF
ncbi:MAG TPA: chloride channel protein, partial [Porphyromonadaceae bacterium]|nr:chloride channel protein [Porphyromonadaceae bacterium]